MEIEYLDEFEELQKQDPFRGQDWFAQRQELVREYSWAVPTIDVIQYCSMFDSLLDIGAGTGYWAYLIEQAGGDVRPIDPSPPDNPYVEVEEASYEDVADEIHSGAVLMVWPPYNEGVATGVAEYSPNHILYVGESPTRGGCTAEDEFFDIVESRYGLVGKIDIPSYTGIYDNFFHYSRKI